MRLSLRNRFKRKGLLICPFLFLFASCASKLPPAAWYYQELDAHKNFQAKRIYFPSSLPLNGLEVEILRSSGETFFFLNSFRGGFIEKEFIEVDLISADSRESLQAKVLKGGQRLLLSEKAAETILKYLNKGEKISLELLPYSTELSSKNFAKVYKKLEADSEGPFKTSLGKKLFKSLPDSLQDLLKELNKTS